MPSIVSKRTNATLFAAIDHEAPVRQPSFLQPVLQQAGVEQVILVGERVKLFKCRSHLWLRNSIPVRL